MLFQAIPSRARLLLLPYSRSVHHGDTIGLRCLSSHGAVAAPYGERRRQPDEEGKAVKVTVWWDFQVCPLPPSVSPSRFGPRVTAALRHAGIRGPVQINAFGDVTLIPRDTQAALVDTGVTFSHVPFSGKGSRDGSFMADLVYWVAQNPPPAHFFLISGDKGFTNILHRLRMSNYNILLSCPEVGCKMLRSAATIMWPWEDLVEEMVPTPKHVNQSPDGLSSSWYGQYRGPFDIQLLKSKNLKALPENTMPHQPQVPKSIVNEIKKVLRFFPQGINLPHLRLELEKNKVSMDRGYFGYTKLSAVLKAMPHDVKFIDSLPGDNQPAVAGIFRGSVERSEQDFDGMDSNQSSIEENHLAEDGSEELPSCFSQSSSSELSSSTRNKTLEADIPSSPSDQLSSSLRKTPHLTTRVEPHTNLVDGNVSLATDVPSSDASSRPQRTVQAVDLDTQVEPKIRQTEADMRPSNAFLPILPCAPDTGEYRGPFDIQLLKSKNLKALPENTMAHQPQVPKSIVNEIKEVLRFYPQGINLSQLRWELKKNKVSMDRGYFGYTKLSALLKAMPHDVKFIDSLPGENEPAVVGIFRGSVERSEQDFEGMDSNQSSIEENHLTEDGNEELPSCFSQSSSSELSSPTRNKTLEADIPSSPSDQLSSSLRKTPHLTTRVEPHTNLVDGNVSLATDVPSSDASSRPQRTVQAVDLDTQVEPKIRQTEADMVAAASTPVSGAQGNIGKKGLLGRILSLWNGLTH